MFRKFVLHTILKLCLFSSLWHLPETERGWSVIACQNVHELNQSITDCVKNQAKDLYASSCMWSIVNKLLLTSRDDLPNSYLSKSIAGKLKLIV